MIARAAAVLLALSFVSCGADAPPDTARAAMPEFELSSLAGDTVPRTAFAGRVVVYDLWATWCAPCHIQSDILREIYPSLRKRGVEVVGIATGEDPQVVRDFAAKRPFPWPVLVDPEETISNRLEVLGLPTLLITDRDGRIAFRQTGIVDSRRLERELTAAGAG
jgi:peroxiredoxin